MTQNIIKLIASYLLSILIISCGSSSGGSNNNNPPKTNNPPKNGNNNDNNKTVVPKTNVVLTSPSKAKVLESQLSAITLSATGDGAITYSISGKDSSSFSVNSSTGVVVFKVKPDYETKKSYNFTAKAKDSKNNEDVKNVIIELIDVDEKPPVFSSSNKISVKENNISVFTVKATDDNMVTYSIASGDSNSFNIDAKSGVITFKKAPDYEKKTSYNFSVIAKDIKNNKSTQNITVTITNIVDEDKPVWESLPTAKVRENTITIIDAIVLEAKDNSSITYSISEGDSDSFNLGLISGRVTFKKSPDYETKKLYKFKATATDDKGNKAVQDISIYITDEDDTPPVFAYIGTMNLKENTIHKFTLKATDDHNITYSINGGDSDKFDLNKTSGLVSFKKAPDYEEKTSYSFTATAKDSKGYTSAQNININIINIVDEYPPVWVSHNIETIKEYEINATILKATDENEITYSISEHNDSFDVNSTTGLVTFKKRANYQRQSSHKFIAHATDKNGNTEKKNVVINLTFVDNILKTFRGHTSSVHTLSLMSSGGYILSGSGDNTLKLWNINTGEIVKTFENHTNYILSAVITLDEKYIIIGSGDHNLKVIDINTAQLVKTFAGHTDFIHSVALSTDGKYVLSGGGYQDKSIRLWVINTGELKRTFTGHTGGVHSVTMSLDGKYALSGSNDETMKLWNMNTGGLMQTFEGHTGVVSSVAITHDGKYALSGSHDETIKVWDTNTGSLIRTIEGHTGNVRSLSITPNGKYVLSGSVDHSLKLWEISTGALIRTFNGHTDEISSTSITSDGHYAFSGSWDHTIKVWDMNVSNP